MEALILVAENGGPTMPPRIVSESFEPAPRPAIRIPDRKGARGSRDQ